MLAVKNKGKVIQVLKGVIGYKKKISNIETARPGIQTYRLSVTPYMPVICVTAAAVDGL